MLYHNRRDAKSNRNTEKRKFFVTFIILVVLVNAAYVVVQRLQPDIVFEPVMSGAMADWQIVDPAYKPDEAFIRDDREIENPLSELRGQWHVVNLWASWCAPCLIELPSLVAAAKQNPHIRFLALNMDAGITAQRLSDLVDRYDIGDIAEAEVGQGPVRAVGRTIHKTFGIKGLPTTILLDPNGKMRAVYLGEAEWDVSDAQAFFGSIQ